MTRATLLTALLASGAALQSVSAFAQAAPPAPAADAPTLSTAPQVAAEPDTAAASQFDFQTGDVILDATGRPDIESSKFQEYRDVVKGVSMPGFRLFGRDGVIRYDLRGENVKQLDERYTGQLKTDWFALNADYNSIVHRIGNHGRTFLAEQSPGVWRMSDTLQQAIQNIWESTPTSQRVFTTFVQPLFASSVQEGATVDVQVVRERTSITADLARNQPFSFSLNYQREQRHGSGGLSSNYLGYQTETPQVTEYLTQDVGFAGAVNRSWGSVRGALHYNWYEDQVKSLVFDSPFRVTDALTATVGTGTAATAVGGPSQGRMINPPDNQAYLGSFGTTLKLAYTTIISHLDAYCSKLWPDSVPILVHGYSHPVPDGTGVWVGHPGWLRPGFVQQGYMALQERTDLAGQFIDKFNVMLSKLKVDTGINSVVYVDVRPALSSGRDWKRWWENELHPTDDLGFPAVAKIFANTLSNL